jgi:hypothetical protein
MPKKPRWRVHLTAHINYFVDVDSDDGVKSVIAKAIDEIGTDPDYHKISENVTVAGIFINDYNTKHFYPFIHEELPKDLNKNWESNAQ